MNIPLISPNIGALEKEYVNRAINSGWVGAKGEFIDRFEEKFAKYIGVSHAITTSSGTSALQLAYLASGINRDATFTLPDTTFRATFNMARLYTEHITEKQVRSDTWNLDLTDTESQFAVAVHLYGNPCDMGQAYKQKYVLIEDCAQALGSTYRSKKCGSYGTTSIFSFHSAKTITTGEGGMVCTNSDIIAKAIRHLKNHAMIRPYIHTGIGFNFRMTNMQAAMGLAQLERIEELIAAKDRISKFYDNNLSKSFIRQVPTKKSKVVKWLNTYKHPNSREIISRLLQSSIECRPGFKGDDYISFPSGTLLTQGELDYVVQTANQSAN